ncbi:MAG: ATP-binding cassette domain-containing protein [Lachnospiraceae bacterium]|nr:ATP-binding cassette domain-containing protein [Lachnospiraceae bacterium]
MIQFENVSKRYADTGEEALSHVSFHLLPGEMAFILGESGSGKTTLLRLLLKELTAEEGTIRINGQDISRIKRGEIPAYRRRIGYVFQDFRLLRNADVYENVAIARRIAGAKERDIRVQVTMALRMVGLEQDYYRPVTELSGGEQQKVCIARAIVSNPCCILADEPTGNLDPRQAREIMLLFERIHDHGVTTLIATHDRQAIRDMDYRHLYLSQGRLQSGE